MAEGGASVVEPVHLIMVQHGLHGGDTQFTVFEDIARERWGGRVLVHRATANCQYGRIGTLYTTSDGVDLGGQRLAKQTMEVAAANPSLQTYSLVGNSLGGLYVRYAAALLEFCRGASPDLPANCQGAEWGGLGEQFTLKPLYFASFVSPHCGIIDSMLPIRLGARAIYRTGSHLLLADSDGCPKEQGGRPRPLLEAMGDADHIFVKALASFQQRFLFANMRGDFQVPYCTAAIVGFHPNLPAKEKDGREPFGLVGTHKDGKGEPPVPEGCKLAHQSELGRNMVAGLRTLEWVRSDVYYNEWSDWLVPPLVHSSPAASGIHYFSKDRGTRIIEWFFDQLNGLN